MGPLAQNFACAQLATAMDQIYLEPNCARCVASSTALSPPPITASGLLRNSGSAPSHTAQADMPFPQNRRSEASGSLRAVAPVEMMMESAS